MESPIVFSIAALKSTASVAKLGRHILQTLYTREYQEAVKEKQSTRKADDIQKLLQRVFRYKRRLTAREQGRGAVHGEGRKKIRK